MKTQKLLLSVCCLWIGFVSGFSQTITVTLDGTAYRLTNDCQPFNGTNALPNGTIIQIRQDINLNGADLSDPLVTAGTGVGQFNYNQMAMNSQSELSFAGKFFSEPAWACLGGVTPVTSRFYLAVMNSNSTDFLWWTNYFTLNTGPHMYYRADSAQWHCNAPPPPPPVPTAPQNLVIKREALSSNIGLYWNPGENADQYRIYRNTVEPIPLDGAHLIGTSADTFFVDVNVIPNPAVLYFYQVVAVNNP